LKISTEDFVVTEKQLLYYLDNKVSFPISKYFF